MQEKIVYGVCNVHIAKRVSGFMSTNPKYGEAKHVDGAVSISLKPIENKVNAKSSNGVNQTIINENLGYEGTLEFINVPTFFLTDILGDTIDENGIVSENRKNKKSIFALMFQFQTDLKGRKYIYFDCQCSRPNVESETTGDKTNISTESFDIFITPRLLDGKIKDYTTDLTPKDIYDNWFSSIGNTKK